MLSKSSLETWDFVLKSEVVEELKRLWFHPAIVVFGSSRFHTCSKYNSCSPDPQAIRTDAFSADTWPNLSYVFPPPPIVSKALARIELGRTQPVSARTRPI